METWSKLRAHLDRVHAVSAAPAGTAAALRRYVIGVDFPLYFNAAVRGLRLPALLSLARHVLSLDGSPANTTLKSLLQLQNVDRFNTLIGAQDSYMGYKIHLSPSLASSAHATFIAAVDEQLAREVPPPGKRVQVFDHKPTLERIKTAFVAAQTSTKGQASRKHTVRVVLASMLRLLTYVFMIRFS